MIWLIILLVLALLAFWLCYVLGGVMERKRTQLIEETAPVMPWVDYFGQMMGRDVVQRVADLERARHHVDDGHGQSA